MQRGAGAGRAGPTLGIRIVAIEWRRTELTCREKWSVGWETNHLHLSNFRPFISVVTYIHIMQPCFHTPGRRTSNPLGMTTRART